MATRTKADTLARARGEPTHASFRGVIQQALDNLADEVAGRSIVWPDARYYDDPVGFARDVLGVDLWEDVDGAGNGQADIARAVAEEDRVSVRSGRKIGKSILAACLVLWWFCTRPDAQVLIAANNDKQINRIVWREVKRLWRRAAKGKFPIDGALNERAQSGLNAGERTAFGFIASDKEAAQGISGVNVLYIVDEASGVEDSFFQAIDGNVMGGGKVFLIGNPTRNEGYHFETFENKRVSKKWRTFTISSLNTPTARGLKVVPGLATAEGIQYEAERYGEDSAEYIIHVLGQHALGEDGRAMPLPLVSEALERYDETPAEGALIIGLDPAGDSVKGDQSAFAARRGLKVMRVQGYRGLDPVGHVATLTQWLAEFRVHERELATVIYDVGGDVGAKLLPALRQLEKNDPYLRLVTVRSSDRAIRYRQNVERRSAELVWNFREWLRAGGAIPDNQNLVEEIRAWEFLRVRHDDEKVKVNKDKVRRQLNRSPDLFDAVALSVWDPTVQDTAAAAGRRAAAKAVNQARAARTKRRMDPFFSRGGGIDPFKR